MSRKPTPPGDKLLTVSVRLTQDTINRLPPASLTGERAQFIRDAVEEKLTREAANASA